MMAEGDVRVSRGALISIELRNIGWVEGSVAWIADNRFGIAFVHEIDPMLARPNVPTGSPDLDTPRFVRPPLKQFEPDKLRKI